MNQNTPSLIHNVTLSNDDHNVTIANDDHNVALANVNHNVTLANDYYVLYIYILF